MTLLHLEKVSLQYPGAVKPVLNQIDYQIQAGDFVILLGSNGSGKSTLLKLLHRHHQPDSGKILFLGKPIAHYQPQEFSRKVAVLTQNCADSLFSSLTVYENYLLVQQQGGFSLTHHHKERQFLQEYLADYNPNLSKKLDSTIHELSGGEKQAFTLALCLLHPPSLLLLDEHTSALDPKTSEQIMQLTQKKMKEHNITCILTTHDLDIALRYGNRILMLHEGSIRKTFDTSEKRQLTKNVLVDSYY